MVENRDGGEYWSASAGYIVRLPNGRTKQVDDGGGRDALPFVWRLVADFRDAGVQPGTKIKINVEMADKVR